VKNGARTASPNHVGPQPKWQHYPGLHPKRCHPSGLNTTYLSNKSSFRGAQIAWLFHLPASGKCP